MRCELPVLLRCCFCFPLRIGLLVWAYFKQIFNVIFLSILILSFCHDYGSIEVATKVVVSIIITLLTLDIVFHVVFIISAFTEDYKKMRIFYRYSICVLCLNVIIMGFFIGIWCFFIFAASTYVLIFLFPIMLPSLFMFMSMIASILQGYLIILVRSEFVKLRNKSRFEFVNHATDAKCTANLDSVKEIHVTV